MNYSVLSIMEKATKKRRPFVVVGEYETREQFKEALSDALICPEDYDFRTVKAYESAIGGGDKPSIVVLHYVDDELDISGSGS